MLAVVPTATRTPSREELSREDPLVAKMNIVGENLGTIIPLTDDEFERLGGVEEMAHLSQAEYQRSLASLTATAAIDKDEGSV